MERQCCTICGGRWINGYMGCAGPGCNQYRIDTEASEWPAMLGHAIRRFVRRATVRELDEEVRLSVADMLDAAHARDLSAKVNGAERFRAAMSRLAAMAMGGEQ